MRTSPWPYSSTCLERCRPMRRKPMACSQVARRAPAAGSTANSTKAQPVGRGGGGGSFSKISTPSKRAAAAACSFSRSMPDRETVAMLRRMGGSLDGFADQALRACTCLTAARSPSR